jgi:hypothetical protein
MVQQWVPLFNIKVAAVTLSVYYVKERIYAPVLKATSYLNAKA